jgi:sugar/nucleoside kinase (ribokinase family)
VGSEQPAAGDSSSIRFSPDIDTPLEVNISDPSGARTFFWRRDPKVLATLDSVDLSLLAGARLLYVDWYDGDHILRATAEAVRREIPIFLNLEHGHQDADTLRNYTRGVKICQVVTDEAQTSKEALEVARRVSEAGVDTVLVTLGASGCLAMRENETIWVEPPEVSVVDGCAAGATFSAGFAYGFLKCWGLEASVRFATAAASLKCSVLGPVAYPLDEIQSTAGQLRVERVAPPS